MVNATPSPEAAAIEVAPPTSAPPGSTSQGEAGTEGFTDALAAYAESGGDAAEPATGSSDATTPTSLAGVDPPDTPADASLGLLATSRTAGTGLVADGPDGATTGEPLVQDASTPTDEVPADLEGGSDAKPRHPGLAPADTDVDTPAGAVAGDAADPPRMTPASETDAGTSTTTADDTPTGLSPAPRGAKPVTTEHATDTVSRTDEVDSPHATRTPLAPVVAAPSEGDTSATGLPGTTPDRTAVPRAQVSAGGRPVLAARTADVAPDTAAIQPASTPPAAADLEATPAETVQPGPSSPDNARASHAAPTEVSRAATQIAASVQGRPPDARPGGPDAAPPIVEAQVAAGKPVERSSLLDLDLDGASGHGQASRWPLPAFGTAAPMEGDVELDQLMELENATRQDTMSVPIRELGRYEEITRLVEPGLGRDPALAAIAGRLSDATSVSFATATRTGTTAFQSTTLDQYELPDQLVRAIRLQWRDGVGEARLRLNPPHLGEVQVSLQVRQGTVTAVLGSDSDVVRGWIRSQQHELKAMLAAQGLDLEQLVVDEDRSSGRQSDHQYEQPRRRFARRPDPDARFEVRV